MSDGSGLSRRLTERRGSRVAASACVCLGLAAAARDGAAQDAGYVAKVRVANATRLDWAYPLLDRSPAKPPAGLLAGYHWEAQS